MAAASPGANVQKPQCQRDGFICPVPTLRCTKQSRPTVPQRGLLLQVREKED